MKTREVSVGDAVGLPLAHDLTEIVPGLRKGAVLRRGHVLGHEDLALLERIGKSRVLVLELEPDEVHEDEAALRLARLVAGPGIEVTLAGESWAEARAAHAGLLGVDAARLERVNAIGELLVATRHGRSVVAAGDLVARLKVVGLCVREDLLDRAAAIAATGGGPILRVTPFAARRVGLVVTGREVAGACGPESGREVAAGRVPEAFEPLLATRLVAYGCAIERKVIVPDDPAVIAAAIREMLDPGAGLGLVLVTGGMSPDDVTVEGIRRSGVDVTFYGVPVSPGAMTLLAYAGAMPLPTRTPVPTPTPAPVPVVGIPAGLLARPRGFLDLLLPLLLAGERPDAGDVAAYGHGGLCLGCGACVFPACPFGKRG